MAQLKQIDTDELVAALRDVKQRMFNDMVEGNGSQPAEVVDSVVFALRKLLPEAASVLYNEVINFYPDYEV